MNVGYAPPRSPWRSRSTNSRMPDRTVLFRLALPRRSSNGNASQDTPATDPAMTTQAIPDASTPLPGLCPDGGDAGDQSVAGWLRAQRLARQWSIAEMGRQLGQAGKAAADHTIPGVAALAAYVRRWEKGTVGVTERYRLLLLRCPGPATQAVRPQPRPVRHRTIPAAPRPRTASRRQRRRAAVPARPLPRHYQHRDRGHPRGLPIGSHSPGPPRRGRHAQIRAVSQW